MDTHEETYFYRQKAEVQLPDDLRPEQVFAHFWRPVAEPVDEGETFAYLEGKALQVLLADYAAAPENLFLNWWRPVSEPVDEDETFAYLEGKALQILLSDYAVADLFLHWWQQRNIIIFEDEHHEYRWPYLATIQTPEGLRPESVFLHFWRPVAEPVWEEPHPSHLRPNIQVLLADYSAAAPPTPEAAPRLLRLFKFFGR